MLRVIYSPMNIVITKNTNPFLDMANFSNAFSAFDSYTQNSLGNAKQVANAWYEFSEFMPWFLAKQASQVSTNELRFSFISIAYEELGEGNRKLIHSEKFAESVHEVGIHIEKGIKLKSIDWLKTIMIKDDYHILGLSLGLEIIANENIDRLISCLSFEKGIKEKLVNSYFFSTHIVNEDNHILINSKNYLRFCKSAREKENFVTGYLEGLEFWNLFWREALNE